MTAFSISLSLVFSVLPWGWWHWLNAIGEAHGGGMHENLSELTKAY
jgi:hypothetical protein